MRLYRWLAYPSLLWFSIFLLIPVGIVFFVSFLSRGQYGGLEFDLTLANYFRLFNVTYLQIILKSVLMSAITTFSCLSVGLLVAWCMATLRERWRSLFVALIALPFLTNLIIRIYSLKSLVGIDGPLQTMLTFLGFEFDPFWFTANPWLVFYGLFTSYLPFAVLPLYSAFEKFNFSLVEAAQDLGAKQSTIVLRVLIPNLKPALWSSGLLVFIPCLGEFVIPDLLGGARTMYIGNLITDQYLKSRNWPLGSAVGMALIGILGLSIFLAQRAEAKE